jgi:two-component system, response regulator PdtaR
LRRLSPFALEPAAAARVPAAERGVTSVNKANAVLVAEDDELIRAVMCELLSDHGFVPAPAASTAEALRLVDERPDLAAAFIDIDLADHGGGYLVARRARERMPEMKIVYTSGAPQAELARERVDDADFVPKPYRPDRVCSLIAGRFGAHVRA